MSSADSPAVQPASSAPETAYGSRPCWRKTYYGTRDAARLALYDIQHNVRGVLAHARRTGKVPNHAYKCIECDGYHLTSQPR